MKNFRIILVVAALLYVVITIVLMMSEDALYSNANWLDLLNYFEYWMVVGLVLLVGLVVADSLKIQNLKKANRKLEQEHAAIKAYLYDVEQTRKAEDEEAGKRIEAFRNSLSKTKRPEDPNEPQP